MYSQHFTTLHGYFASSEIDLHVKNEDTAL